MFSSDEFSAFSSLFSLGLSCLVFEIYSRDGQGKKDRRRQQYLALGVPAISVPKRPDSDKVIT